MKLMQLKKLIKFHYWLPMGVLFIAFVGGGLLFPHSASALFDWDPRDIFIEILLAFARLCIGMSVAFLRIFMEIAAYNGYIDAPPVILGWYMVRDVANMFFVVALLVIAFGTILGLEQYEWKKSLVKLVLAAVLINFSRLIIGVAIDASHIFTITFLNAVEGAAGGNVIGMLHLDKIMSLVSQGQAGGAENIRTELLVAAMAGVIFALVSAIAIGSYLVVMTIRVVVLWVMIIVSPLVFILSAIPKTKSYADQFWQELTKYIIVAPTMVFFLWLAFATFGNGDINNHVGVKSGGTGSEDVAQILDIPGESPAVSIAEITTWENMSSFIIAIAFLFLGLVQTQKIGVIGSGVVGGALNFAKQAATIASGYAAGRFLVGQGKKGLRFVAMKAPIVGGEKWQKRYAITKGKIGGWYAGKGMQVTKEGDKIREQMERAKKREQLLSSPEGRAEVENQLKDLEAKKAALATDAAKSGKEGKEAQEDVKRIEEEIKIIIEAKEAVRPPEEKITALEGRRAEVLQKGVPTIEESKELEEIEKQIAAQKEVQAKAALPTPEDEEIKKLEGQKDRLEEQATAPGVAPEASEKAQKELKEIEKQITAQKEAKEKRVKEDGQRVEKAKATREVEKLESQLAGQMGGGPIGWLARSSAALEKQEGKITKQAENRKKLLLKRTSSESTKGLGVLLGINAGMGSKNGIWGTGIMSDRYGGIEAQDRIEEGWFQAEELRSRAKDLDKQTEGRLAMLKVPRLKSKEGELFYEFDRGSMMDQIENHKVKGEVYEAKIHDLQTHAREHILEKTEEKMKEITNSPALKGLKDNLGQLSKKISGLQTVMRDLKNAEAAKKGGLDSPDYIAAMETLKKEHNIEEVTPEIVEKTREEQRKEETNRVVVQKKYTEVFEEALLKGGVKEIPMWELSREQAKKAYHDVFYKGRETQMVDDAAQTHIWNKKGIAVPNLAQLGIIEQLGKDFRPMNYESAVVAGANHAANVTEKRLKGEEIGFDDKAISIALAQKLEEGKWLDDLIIPYRKLGADAAKKLVESLGEGGKAAYADIQGQIDQRRGGERGRGGGGPPGRYRMKGMAGVMLGMLNQDKAEIRRLLELSRRDKTALTDLKEKLRTGASPDDAMMGLARLERVQGQTNIAEAVIDRIREMDDGEVDKLIEQIVLS